MTGKFGVQSYYSSTLELVYHEVDSIKQITLTHQKFQRLMKKIIHDSLNKHNEGNQTEQKLHTATVIQSWKSSNFCRIYKIYQGAYMVLL